MENPRDFTPDEMDEMADKWGAAGETFSANVYLSAARQLRTLQSKLDAAEREFRDFGADYDHDSGANEQHFPNQCRSCLAGKAIIAIRSES